MSNFSFLLKRFLGPDNVIYADSEYTTEYNVFSAVPFFKIGDSDLQIIDNGSLNVGGVYRIKCKVSGDINHEAKYIFNDACSDGDYYVNKKWKGVGYFHNARGDNWVYPKKVVKQRVTSDGFNLYSVAISQEDGTTLESYKLDTTTGYFNLKGVVNDRGADGGVFDSYLLYINDALYCLLSKIDLSGDLILKVSSDEGEFWSTISEFELCSYSDNLDTLTAAYMGGILMVMGSYTINSTWHIVNYSYSISLGYDWVKTNEIFKVDMTSSGKIGVSLCADEINKQFLLAEKCEYWHQDTSTFRDRIYYYDTLNCEDFNFINVKTTRWPSNNNTEDSTSVFEHNIIAAIGRDVRRVYSFCAYGDMGHWRKYHHGILANSCKISDGSDMTASIMYKGKRGLDNLRGFSKYLDHHVLIAQDGEDSSCVNVLHLGEWSTISDMAEWDSCYFPNQRYFPFQEDWTGLMGGPAIQFKNNNELHLICDATSNITYMQGKDPNGNLCIDLWRPYVAGVSHCFRSDVPRRVSSYYGDPGTGATVDAYYSSFYFYYYGFGFKFRFKIPYWTDLQNDTTNSSNGLVFNLQDYNVAPVALGLAHDCIFLKSAFGSSYETHWYWSHNMMEHFHDVMVVLKKQQGIFYPGLFRLDLFIKKEDELDWTCLLNKFKVPKLDASITFPIQQQLQWGAHLYPEYNENSDCTVIFKEFKYSTYNALGAGFPTYFGKDTGGVLAIDILFDNPTKLVGCEATIEDKYLYQDVKIKFTSGNLIAGDSWVIKHSDQNLIDLQGDKGNIFRDRPFLEWRSLTDTTDSEIIFHYNNESFRFDTFVMMGVNFHYCHLQGQNVTPLISWDTSGPLAFDTTIDFRDGGDVNNVYNNIIIKTDTTDIIYFRIYIPQQDTTEGYYKIGQVGIGLSLILNDNPEYPISEIRQYKSYKVVVESGEAKIITKENLVRMWNLNFKAVDFYLYKDLYNLVEETRWGYRPVFFSTDYENERYNVSFVRILSDMNNKKTVGELREFDISLEEVI